jgi:chorismate mutase
MSELTLKALAECRDRIDEIDRRLLDLLNQRTSIVEQIGNIKRHLHLPIYEPKREDQVLANVLTHNQGPLPPEAIQRLFERIIDEMRTLQKLKIALPEPDISSPGGSSSPAAG